MTETTIDTTIDLDQIVQILREKHGIENAYVEQTGGGCATIYAGPTREEEEYGTRYAAVAGPGSYGWGKQPSTGDLKDFFIGADDQGESQPITAAEYVHIDPARWHEQIADLIAAQAQLADPTKPLTAGEARHALLTDDGKAMHLVSQIVSASMDGNFRTMDTLYKGERKHRMALEVLLDIFFEHADEAYMGTVKQYEEAIAILRFKSLRGEFHGGNWIDVLSKQHPEYREDR